jgi:hypothetical protein
MPCEANFIAIAAVNPTASRLEWTVKVICLNLLSYAILAFSASSTEKD